MTITSESILERLRNGETAEDIANEMIASLNKAIKVQEDEAEAARKAEEVAKAKAAEEAKREEKLNTLATAIAGAIGEYMKLSVPEYAEDMTMPTTEEVRETLDRAIKILASVGSALDKFVNTNVFETKEPVISSKVVDTLDPITKFLRDNRLL